MRTVRDGSGGGSARACGWVLAAALMLGGCGGGVDTSNRNAMLGPLLTGTGEARQLEELMRRYYYWNDRMPTVAIDASSTAQAALEALRYRPIDRYSFIEDAVRFNQFYGEGRAVGIGITYRIDGETIRLRAVQPESPAGAAGLARGDAIVSIGGEPAGALAREGRVSDAFGPQVEGVEVTLGVARNGATRSVTIAKAAYDVQSVLDARVLDAAARADGTRVRVGYLNLATFIGTTERQWDQHLAALVAEGVRDLIVDLRENGGGLLGSAAHVGATLAPEAAAGQPFVRLRYNDAQRALDQRIDFPSIGRSGVERVVFITSPQTCSASESLVNGLRPFREAVTIGETTCGKPVGFNPQPIADKVANFVTFATTNRDGVGDYFDGLEPACATGQDALLPFGDVADARIAAALQWLGDGTCPPSASPSASASAGRARGVAGEPYPGRRGAARLHGIE
ncbi:MAG: S41 family peptidase [Lautropia sp.]